MELILHWNLCQIKHYTLKKSFIRVQVFRTVTHIFLYGLCNYKCWHIPDRKRFHEDIVGTRFAICSYRIVNARMHINVLISPTTNYINPKGRIPFNWTRYHSNHFSWMYISIYLLFVFTTPIFPQLPPPINKKKPLYTEEIQLVRVNNELWYFSTTENSTFISSRI